MASVRLITAGQRPARAPRSGSPADEALELRSRLAAHRRREAALAALYETAGYPASLRDLEDVLPAIVSHARTLVGTDLAYLVLSDPEEGDTYVRVTDGIATDGVQDRPARRRHRSGRTGRAGPRRRGCLP
ncbi:hypothetical protein [Streptomyces sp. I8-5]|uniref:hypothetical protein n=1 Tax=Streptomyces sp. I8-5 TaxID=3104277 RepID=UPI003869B031